MIPTRDRLTTELENLHLRLNQYNELPLPDQIKQRLQDAETDITHAKEVIEELRQARNQDSEAMADLDEKIADLEKLLQDKKDNNLDFEFMFTNLSDKNKIM